ncbi:MAG TPA: hypothetical protein VGQ71_11920 [Terriglobales bacterium]|nr:hypothetical protein [Terriglobales bacterium]
MAVLNRSLMLTFLLACLAGVLKGQASDSYTIRTIAGGASLENKGDGQPATSIFIDPGGLGLDGGGNLYITDLFKILRITPNGIATRYAGTDYSIGLDLDSSGSLYFAETIDNRIRRISPSGAISTVAGRGGFQGGYDGDNQPATSAQLNGPRDVAVDSQGTIYIADTENHRVRKLTSEGNIVTLAGNGTKGFSGDGGPATSAQLQFPVAVGVDSLGDVYIADSSNHRIRKVTSDGIINTIAGEPRFGGDGGLAISASLNSPNGLSLDSAVSLYIADTANYRVRKVTVDGRIISFAGDLASCSFSRLEPILACIHPVGLALDSAGNLFISEDGGFERVQIVTSIAAPLAISTSSPLPVGQMEVPYATSLVVHGGVSFTYVWSINQGPFPDGLQLKGLGGEIAVLPGRSGTFAFVVGVTDGSGAKASLPVALSINPLLLTEPFVINTVAGNGPVAYSGEGFNGDGKALLSSLNSPAGLAVDTAGNLYIADTLNDRIRKVSLNGVISTVAGMGPTFLYSQGFSGDGERATSARLNSPQGSCQHKRLGASALSTRL